MRWMGEEVGGLEGRDLHLLVGLLYSHIHLLPVYMYAKF